MSVKVAQTVADDFELELLSLKLNLDAIEIDWRMPQCYSEAIGIWEEPADLKIVRKKIEQINDTVNQPQLLFERDELKLRPMLQKWNNTTGEVMTKVKRQKTLKQIAKALNEELKDSSSLNKAN